MTAAICFKCGKGKTAPFDSCPECGAIPASEHERAVSFVLCDRLSAQPQLLTFARDIGQYGFPIIDRELLERAKVLVNDGARRSERTRTRDHQRDPVEIAEALSERRGKKLPASIVRKEGSRRTAIHQNAFCVLGASTRDTARRIIELAEEHALALDPSECAKARSDLLAPRTRVAIEMAWMPGVAPQRANSLLGTLCTDIDAVRTTAGIPNLAHANLIAAAFELLDPGTDVEVWIAWIETFATIVDGIEAEAVLRDINEDRAVSGFAEVRQLEAIEEEVANRRRHYTNCIKLALDAMPSEKLVLVVSELVRRTTDDGARHAPLLIDEVVDVYRAEADRQLEVNAERIAKLVEAVRRAAPEGVAAVKPSMDRLDDILCDWSKLAKPIQVSLKARGLEHELSRTLALEVRSLCVDLCNKHGMFEIVNEFTMRLRNIFGDLPEIRQTLRDDSNTIKDILKERDKQRKDKEAWEKDITYETEVGMLFPDKLAISPRGLQWKSQTYPLDSITQLRWGGVRHSVNGIPTGTRYHVAFGDRSSVAVIELKDKDTFAQFVDKMWKAVGVRLMMDLLEALKGGRKIPFGDAIIDDVGAQLTRHKFLQNEAVYLPWGKTHIWSADGSFYIGSREDKKVYSGMSYINDPNAHICEAVVRAAFEKGAIPLSTLLKK